MEKNRLRSADIVTGVLLIVFGIWILIEAFQMPMRDSYGGVMNVWYVSPALFPIVIGGGVILLSVNILINGIRSSSLETLKEWKKARKTAVLTDSGYRFIAILLPLLSLVYMNLQRIDFFISVAFFLSFSITVFYLDDPALLRRFLLVYAVQTGILLLIFILKIDDVLNAMYPYSIDIIALGLLIFLILFMRLSIRGKREYRVKFVHAMLMSFITPFVLVPVFRFMLRVPLPREGGIVDLMSLAYYALR